MSINSNTSQLINNSNGVQMTKTDKRTMVVTAVVLIGAVIALNTFFSFNPWFTL